MAATNSRGKSDRQVGYAVIGLGHIAQSAVLPSFAHARNSRVVALVSGDEEKRRKLSRKYHCDAYDMRDLDDVLDRPDVDAVYLATPNDKHADSGGALRQGGRARALREAARDQRGGVPADDRRGEGERGQADDRVPPAFRACQPGSDQADRTGRIGEPRFFSSTFAYQVKPGKSAPPPSAAAAPSGTWACTASTPRATSSAPIPRRFSRCAWTVPTTTASRTSTKA